MTLARTLRTLRYLRPEQVMHRLWNRGRAPWFASSLYARLCLAPRRPLGPLLFPPALWPGDEDNGSRILNGSIRLIGREHPLAEHVDWRAQGLPLLWRFTLHYFEWLADLEAIGGAPSSARARALMDDWMAAHPRPDAVAWHPYPLSLRVYAWLRQGPFVLDGAEGVFRDRYRDSLDRQARHLARVVERDIGGNHLIKNLKSLIAAHRCLDGQTGADAEAWLEHEVSRQVLADGGHYERSPSYHLQVLCDLLDVRALIAEEAETAPKWLEDAIARMGGAMAFFRHGDGGLALFNDGDTGAPELLAAAERHLGGRRGAPDDLPECGYHRMAAEGALVLMDAGPCCPDDLPAHAHADTLSFEFSHLSQRLVVNCGTNTYQDAAWRNRLRGTASHSTVSVDGEDSAEVYGTFRLGRRPRQARATRHEDASGIRLIGHHDGYRHLGLIHHRSLALAGDGRRLAGEDRLESSGAAADRRVTARFHLHPNVAAVQRETGAVDLRLPDGGAWRFEAPGEEVRLQESVYAPRFNEMTESRQIVIEKPPTGGDRVIRWEFRVS